jgi:hypothetical protein
LSLLVVVTEIIECVGTVPPQDAKIQINKHKAASKRVRNSQFCLQLFTKTCKRKPQTLTYGTILSFPFPDMDVRVRENGI